MEITCQKCATAFTVEEGMGESRSLEAVCPGCFTLQAIPLQSFYDRKLEARDPEPQVAPPLLGGSSVADRLRDGFSLLLEIRHPSRPTPIKLNPFELRRRIYLGELTGEEEFQGSNGRWQPVASHPELLQVFKLVGKELTPPAQLDGEGRLMVGWRSIGPTRAGGSGAGEKASPPLRWGPGDGEGTLGEGSPGPDASGRASLSGQGISARESDASGTSRLQQVEASGAGAAPRAPDTVAPVDGGRAARWTRALAVMALALAAALGTWWVLR